MMGDYRLHLHFGPPRCRDTTIICGNPHPSLLAYFEDSGYSLVEIEGSTFRAIIEPTLTDVRGHWFLGPRPLFSAEVRVPLGTEPRQGPEFERDERGMWWLVVAYEPGSAVLESLYLAAADAETNLDYTAVIQDELLACSLQAARHRTKEVRLALDRIGKRVDESHWTCVVLENLELSDDGIVRTGDCPAPVTNKD